MRNLLLTWVIRWLAVVVPSNDEWQIMGDSKQQQLEAPVGLNNSELC